MSQKVVRMSVAIGLAAALVVVIIMFGAFYYFEEVSQYNEAKAPYTFWCAPMPSLKYC